MNIYVYKDGMSEKEQKDGAYWERNMLALLLATYNNVVEKEDKETPTSGWYYDTHNNWDGWKRVISIKNGTICFHIPDDFNVGDLQQIKPNWNGHTTEEKWKHVMNMCGVKE